MGFPDCAELCVDTSISIVDLEYPREQQVIKYTLTSPMVSRVLDLSIVAFRIERYPWSMVENKRSVTVRKFSMKDVIH